MELRVYSGVLKYRHSYRAYQFLMVPHTQIANTGGYNPPGSLAGVGGRRAVGARWRLAGVLSGLSPRRPSRTGAFHRPGPARIVPRNSRRSGDGSPALSEKRRSLTLIWASPSITSPRSLHPPDAPIGRETDALSKCVVWGGREEKNKHPRGPF